MNAAIQPAGRKGLTLVELMVSITIFFILAAIAVSELGRLPEEHRRAAAANNARAIDYAYMVFSMGGDGRKTMLTPTQAAVFAARRERSLFEPVANVEDAALVLARFSDLNDAAVWFIETDPKLASLPIPHQVALGDPRTAKSCSPDFQKTAPKAWALVAGLPASLTGGSTPLCWTYGLDVKTGQWSADSPWQGKGGHVAYLDGHVEWMEKIPANTPGFEFSHPGGAHPEITPEVLNAMGKPGPNKAQAKSL